MGKGQRLYDAAERGDVGAIDNLLRANWLGDSADVNWRSPDGHTPLHPAAWYGHVEAVRALLQAGANVNARTQGGWAPMSLASFNGHSQVVLALLWGGGDVGAADQSWRTPLHHAAANGHLEVVRALMSKGADAGARDKDGKTPVDAVGAGNIPHEQRANLFAIRVALAAAAPALANVEELYTAAERGDAAGIQQLVRRGANVSWPYPAECGETPLHVAARYNCMEAMRVLLRAGADVHAKDEYGSTPLHMAAIAGHVEAAQMLLDADADVHAIVKGGRTPLHYAAASGHLEVVQALLSRGALAGAMDKDSKTPVDLVGTGTVVYDQRANLPVIRETLQLSFGPALGNAQELYSAAVRGDSAAIQKLVKSGASVRWYNFAEFGRTPLHAASRHGSVEAVRALLQAGADVHAKDEYGNAPLHEAAKYGCVEAVRVLLQAGAHVPAKEEAGWTALHLAAGCDRADVVKALVIAGQVGSTPVHVVAHPGHLEATRVLLQAGADVHAKDKAGCSPLHLAAGCNNTDAVQLLLQAGTGVDACDRYFRTPLHMAADRGHLEAVQVLLQAGADVHAKDEVGCMPLHTAAQEGRLQAVRALLRAGAAVGAKATHGRTPLHMAAAYNRLELVQTLLQAGADVFAKSKAGWTVLHLAADNGSLELVRILLQAGAGVNTKTQTGWTPLHRAVYEGHQQVVQEVLQAGADVGAVTKDGRTALDLSARCQAVRQDITKVLQAAANGHPQPAKPSIPHEPFTSSGSTSAPPGVPQAATTPSPWFTAAASASTHAASAAPPPSAKPRTAATPPPSPPPPSRNTATSAPPPPPAAPSRNSTASGPPPTPPFQSSSSAAATPPTAAPASADRGPVLYTGGVVTLPSRLTASQEWGVAKALAGAGLQAAAQLTGAVVTCNPVGMLMAPMQLLRAVQQLMQQGVFSRERLQRAVARIAALEPALQQLAEELRDPVRTGAPLSVVHSLCSTLLLLANVMVQLQELQRKVQTKGPGLLRRSLEVLKAGAYEQEVACLDLELRDCVTQLSEILNIAHFTQVAQMVRAREELQVAQWQRQNEADRARDLQQLEGLVVEAVGGVQVLQQQLEEQKVVLDGQAVGLQQVADWLQQMHASSSIIGAHLQQLHSKVDDINDGVQGMDVDLGDRMDSMQDELRFKLDALIHCMSSKPGSRSARQVAPPMVVIERARITIPAHALAQGTFGGFGTVFKVVHDGCEVALKMYNHRVLGQLDSEDNMEEALLMSRANHHNVVRCYGIVRDPDTPEGASLHGSLVMEWVGGGNLYKWLQSNHRSIGLKARVQLALQVAAGMRHLHERRLVHGDLKPQNVLLTAAMPETGVPQAKICDFGLAKHSHTSAQVTYQQKKAYTITYTSPERMTTWSRTKQDDVYAFGILLYFIATSRNPFASIPQEQLRVAVQEQAARPDIDQWVQAQRAGGAEHEVAELYCKLAKQCWAADPGQRPTFEAVYGDLSVMVAQLQG